MFVSTKDALSSYYYLIAVDEHVTDEERDMFDAIGNDIDPQMFGNYREELVDGCRNTVNQASLSTDRFEMLVEAVDDALEYAFHLVCGRRRFGRRVEDDSSRRPALRGRQGRIPRDGTVDA